MFHLVANFLRQQGWQDWSLVQIESANIIWWVFRPQARNPEVIGKLPRSPHDTVLARREAAALGSLRRVAGAVNIPRLMFQAELPDGGFLFVQSGVAGRPLAERTDHFDQVLPWLDAFQKAVSAQGTVAESLCRSITCCRAQLADAAPAELELLMRAEAEAARLDTVQAAAVHGDFWSGNVLNDGGRLGVLDWSNYHFGGPLEDLHNFAAAQGYESRGGDDERMRSMWRVFFSDGPLMRRTADATARMLAGRKLDSSLLRPMFLLFLINRISYVEFSNHAAWRRLAVHYLESGMPELFTVAG